MTLATAPGPVAQKIYDILTAGKAASGLKDVWYGDQSRVPFFPCASVEAGPMSVKLEGTQYWMRYDFQVYVVIYHALVGDTQVNKKEVEALIPVLSAQIHAQSQLGGLVVQGWVAQVDPGYVMKNGVLMHAARMSWQGMSKSSLPLQG